MPDYIYLLENRLSADQQSALRQLREAASEADTILFLAGDAVRDLTSGHAVRGLEVAVHGNALDLKKTIEKLGGNVWGENEASRSLYLCFPGTVRVDLVSTHHVEAPRPGKLVYHPDSIQEYLRSRDFTVNAMAISLNEGSFGLLMDPMNGAADIESRTLRLVSNYGFLDQPSLLISATRYIARLGWEMEPKTRARYDSAREAGVIEHLSGEARSRELEQIAHEEEGLKVLRALEAEGWMQVLFPAWTAAKADEEALTELHDLAVKLLIEGVHADMSAAQMRLLTAKLPAKDLAALKKLMLRPGFVEEWNSLDGLAAGFAKALAAKENEIPSASFKLFTSYDPEAILWLGFTSKDTAIKEYFNRFLEVWPEVRQRIPHALMQEMRITAELPAYEQIVQAVFLELIDGKLTTPEEARAFLEPYSPPAPPPTVTIKRSRAKRGAESKIHEDSFNDEEDESEERLDDDEDLDDIGGEDDESVLGPDLPKVDLNVDLGEDSDDDDDEPEDEKPASSSGKKSLKPPAQAVSAAAHSGPEAPLAKAEKRPVKPAASEPGKSGKTALVSRPKVEPEAESKSRPAATEKSPAKSKPASGKAVNTPVQKLAAEAKPVSKKIPAKSLAKPLVKAPVKGAPKPSAKASSKPAAKAPALKHPSATKESVSASGSKTAAGKKAARAAKRS
jgi:tRNA nucleotidyltransferase/poly(A) polymerase